MAQESASTPAFFLLGKIVRLLGFFLFLFCHPIWLSAQTNPVTMPGSINNILVMIQGKVEVSTAGNDAWSPARLHQTLRPSDRVRTGERSRAEVYLRIGMTIQLSESSTLEVLPSTQPSFWKGIFKVFNRERGRKSELKLPGASAAVRGTDFLVQVTEEGSSELTILDGQVLLRNETDEVLLANNERGLVEPGRAPRKSAVVEAVPDMIQWSLYYPAVLNPDELQFSREEQQASGDSLRAYRSGDLLKAVEIFPWQLPTTSDAARAYSASLLLSVGQVDKARALLQTIRAAPGSAELNQLIAAIKFENWNGTNPPGSSSEWLAESYYRQSRYQLQAALDAARNATTNAPDFGFAWARVAELEFSFGHTTKALTALEKSLQLSPRNAQAIALNGFLLAAQNKISAAFSQFDQAIAVDSALGNAWLGRGLCSIRQGRSQDGLRDLLVAASLESQRSLLRSYLGKAFADANDENHAMKELALATQLDPNDPTSWLYSALLKQWQNRINEAIADLEVSQERNDNRQLYRSRLLLDQDRAVRSASLASIYRDNGMTEVSVREASRAVTDDYGNYSAHLFLANSFDQVRDRTGFNLRYETVWFNELLLANLLAPVGAGIFSQNISQQEYSRLFDVKRIGLTATTTVRSDGQYHEEVSQFGTFDKFGYSLDLDYQHNDGVRPNNELDLIHWFTKFKFQLTPQDTLFLLTEYRDFHSGDNFQYYDWHQNVKTNFTFDEVQTPNVLIGYHREWTPGVHTLLLAGRLENDQHFSTAPAGELVLDTDTNKTVQAVQYPPFFDVKLRSQVEVYTVELNQILQSEGQTFVFGGRFQTGEFETANRLLYAPNPDVINEETNVTEQFERFGAYGYYTIEPVQNLFLTAGLSYDHVTFPRNFRAPPISSGQTSREQLGPKAAMVYSPRNWLTLRGIYARSLSGVSLDEDYRLEPPQLAGFVQTFRTIIPESVAGSVSVPPIETFGMAVDLKFKTRTYISFNAESLASDVNQEIGVFERVNSLPPFFVSSTRQRLEFNERSAGIIVNQLLGDEWSLSTSYKFVSSELESEFPDIPKFVFNSADLNEFNNTSKSDLHLFGAALLFNHPCGFFARGEVNCFFQDDTRRTFTGNTAATVTQIKVEQPSEDFTQFNAYIGWRFPHQFGDVTFGVLNIAGSDYHLNPLNSYPELPHERVYAAQLRLRF